MRKPGKKEWGQPGRKERPGTVGDNDPRPVGHTLPGSRRLPARPLPTKALKIACIAGGAAIFTAILRLALPNLIGPGLVLVIQVTGGGVAMAVFLWEGYKRFR